MQQETRRKRLPFHPEIALLVLLLIAPFRLSASETQKLIVATTFPEEFARTVGKAFEQRHPGMVVSFSYRATSTLVGNLIADEGRGADLVWMSSPVGIRALMQNGLLAGAPEACVFAYSRFGLMWRQDLLDVRTIAAPSRWQDLAQPRYRGEIGMSSPSRSGTTAIFVEAVLQAEGWRRGWALLQEMGGNLATVTARSIGVQEGLLQGRFSIGIGVDFLARTTGESDTPLRFLASPADILLPASACVLRSAENPGPARVFSMFLRSSEGQALLAHPRVQRIPLDEGRRTLAAQPPQSRAFDTALAEQRGGLVAVLFDQLITYRRGDLGRFWAAYHDTEARAAALEENGRPRKAEIANRLAQARHIAGAVSVPDFMTTDTAFTDIFKETSGPTSELRGIRSRLQEDWTADSRRRLREAGALVRSASDLIEEQRPSLASGP